MRHGENSQMAGILPESHCGGRVRRGILPSMKSLLRILVSGAPILGVAAAFAQAAPADFRSADENAPTLNGLKLEFDIERAALTKPLKELDDLFRAQLEKLGQQAQSKGALEELIAVRAELAGLDGNTAAETGTDSPELAKARGIYEKAKADRYAQMRQGLLPVIARHKVLLETLRADQTRQNLLEDAIRTNEELTKVAALETRVRESAAVPEAGVSPFSLAGATQRAIKVRAQVDGKTHLHFQGSKLWFDHSKGTVAPPGRHEGEFPTYLDEKTAWMPVWTGKVTEPREAGFKIPEDEGLKVRVWQSAGRGMAEIVQQPSAANGYTVIVELRDENKEGRRFFGSDWIEFRLTW